MPIQPLNIDIKQAVTSPQRPPSRDSYLGAARRAFESGDQESARILIQKAKELGPIDDMSQRLTAGADSALWRATNPAASMSGKHQILAGFGKAFTDVALGARQIAGQATEQEAAIKRQRDQSLMSTGLGRMGNMGGLVAMGAATSFVPGANTLIGAGIQGALLGALQPTVDGESRSANAAIGAGAGVAGQALGGALARPLAQRAANNSPMRKFLSDAVDEGYSIPPSYAGGSLPLRMAEGLSGKNKSNQLATIRNQGMTNHLAARAIGVNGDLTDEAIKDVIDNAFESGYEPIKRIGRITTDSRFMQTLDDIIYRFRGATGSFPGFVDDTVTPRLNALKVADFNSDDAISAIKAARSGASKAFRDGDNNLGLAYKEAAEAIEDQIERYLANYGPTPGLQQRIGAPVSGLLDRFRNARTIMAKAFEVDRAFNGANVNAMKLAQALAKGAPLTDELQTVAQTATQFGDVMRVPRSGYANPFTVVDAGAGAMAASLSASSGRIGPLIPYIGLEAGRIGSRSLVLSRPVQRAMASQLKPTQSSRMVEALLKSSAMTPALSN